MEIYFKNSRIASHERSYEEWKPSTKLEHMPPSHQQYLDQTPSKMVEWAERMGPNTKEVINKILDSRKYIQQSYRACLGVKRLEQDYGRERLEAACRRAVAYHACGYRNIKSILASGLDKQQEYLGENKGYSMPEHKNIRGKIYYN